MSVYFRKSRRQWTYDFTLKGERHVGYCKHTDTGQPARNKREAEAIEETLKVALRSRPANSLSSTPEYTIAECFADWLDSIQGTSNYHNAADHIAEFLSCPEFAPDKPVTAISDTDIERYVQRARQHKLRIWIGGPDRDRAILQHKQHNRPLWKDSDRLRSASTINHYLATLSAALRRAHETRNPATGAPLLPMMPRIKKLRASQRLPRQLPDSVIGALIRNEGVKRVRTRVGTKLVARKPPAQHVVDAVMLCRLMGFRKNEVVNLDLRQMDDEHRSYRLPGDATKGKRDEFVRANPLAWEILTRLRKQALESGNTRLILVRGSRGQSKTEPLRPIKSFRSAFDRLMDDMELKGIYMFHNTKATYVTSISKVTDSATTQKLARHIDYKTTQRYIDLVDERTKSAVEAMDVRIDLTARAPDLDGWSSIVTKHLFVLLGEAIRRSPGEYE
ncbi:tyrosine-type recombinase/integrase [Ferrovibrio sp.]|uniref:tyrosine-type recombinase/integrase n=1 Tax=Ferrovibrio sp. TaxID=1917215 RepID=UPI003519C103